MRRHLAILAILLLAFTAGAQTNVVRFDLGDFTTSATALRRVTLTPLDAPMASGGKIITKDKRTYTTDSNGVFSVTNMVAADYQGEVLAPPASTVFYLTVTNSGTNAMSGIGLLVPTTSVGVAKIGYTKAQVDAAISAATNNGALLLNGVALMSWVIDQIVAASGPTNGVSASTVSNLIGNLAYPIGNPSGFVDHTVTNGLATTNAVIDAVNGATNPVTLVGILNGAGYSSVDTNVWLQKTNGTAVGLTALGTFTLGEGTNAISMVASGGSMQSSDVDWGIRDLSARNISLSGTLTATGAVTALGAITLGGETRTSWPTGGGSTNTIATTTEIVKLSTNGISLNVNTNYANLGTFDGLIRWQMNGYHLYYDTNSIPPVPAYEVQWSTNAGSTWIAVSETEYFPTNTVTVRLVDNNMSGSLTSYTTNLVLYGYGSIGQVGNQIDFLAQMVLVDDPDGTSSREAVNLGTAQALATAAPAAWSTFAAQSNPDLNAKTLHFDRTWTGVPVFTNRAKAYEWRAYGIPLVTFIGPSATNAATNYNVTMLNTGTNLIFSVPAEGLTNSPVIQWTTNLYDPVRYISNWTTLTLITNYQSGDTWYMVAASPTTNMLYRALVSFGVASNALVNVAGNLNVQGTITGTISTNTIAGLNAILATIGSGGGGTNGGITAIGETNLPAGTLPVIVGSTLYLGTNTSSIVVNNLTILGTNNVVADPAGTTNIAQFVVSTNPANFSLSSNYTVTGSWNITGVQTNTTIQVTSLKALSLTNTATATVTNLKVAGNLNLDTSSSSISGWADNESYQSASVEFRGANYKGAGGTGDIAIGSATASITMIGTNVIFQNGLTLNTNTAPIGVTNGTARLWNSNGVVWLRTSTPGSTTEGTDTKLAP